MKEIVGTVLILLIAGAFLVYLSKGNATECQKLIARARTHTESVTVYAARVGVGAMVSSCESLLP